MQARLTLMGEPRLIDGSGKVIRIPPKAFGLAAAISLAPSATVGRPQAADLLWGSSEGRYGNLRKLIWATKTSLRDHALELFVSTDDLIAIDSSSVLVDVALIQALLDQHGTADLGQLSGLYRGDLLYGLAVDEPDFLDWLHVQRAKLRNTFLNAMSERLSSEADQTQDVARKTAAWRVLEIDPYNESACRLLMAVHAREGESAQVGELYRAMSVRLAEDLSASPSAATTRLYRDLMAAGAQELIGSAPQGPAPMPLDDVRARALSTSLPTLCLLRTLEGDALDLSGTLGEALDDLEIGLSRSKLLRIVAARPAWRLEVAEGSASWPSTYGIDYVVESTSTMTGDGAHVHVRLIEIGGRAVIWAERIIVDNQDRVGCRERIASLIMSISNQIERHELASAASVENRSPYQWYLSGRYCLRTMDLPSVRRGRRAFRAALELDADFIPALVGTARALQLEWLLLARGDFEILAESENLARTAIRLDPEHAVAHRILGFALLGRRAYPASVEAYECADRLYPMHPDTLAEHGIMLTQTNQLDRGRQKLELAFRLNPAPPDYYYWGMAWNLYLSGDCWETIETIGAMQNPSTAYRLLASAHARLGNQDMAQQYVAKVMDIHPDFTISHWVSLVPLRDRQHIDFYAEGLRLAGFR